MKRFGPYRVLRSLGRGGMGEVFEVAHEGTGAHYALKTLLALDDDVGRARFAREVAALGRLDHPSLVVVHAAEAEGPTPYVVTDLLPGGSLQERLARLQGFPPEVALELIERVAAGVEAAHALGVLHRDLKPDNVLFRGESPLLADFGLAKLLDERSLTATGVILGTPSYMSPEQIDPSRGAVDERSDVYGLGAILYHCLAGQPPFTGPSAMAVLVQVTQDEPRPPSAFAEVPRQLEGVCLRALAKDMQQRQPSAVDLVRELEAFLAGERPAPRWRPAVALGLLAALGALGAAFALGRDSGQGAPATPAPTRAPARRTPRPTKPIEEPEAPEPQLSVIDQLAWQTVGQRRMEQVSEALVFLDRFSALGYRPARIRLAYVACLSESLHDPEWGPAELLSGAAEGDPSALTLLVKLHLRPAAGLVGIEPDRPLALAAGFLYQKRFPEGDEMDLVRGELAKVRARTAATPSDEAQALDTIQRALEAAQQRLRDSIKREWSALDERIKNVDDALGQETALRRAARRGVARAWGKLGRGFLLHGPKQNVPLGTHLLALSVLAGDEESAFDLAGALVAAHEFRDSTARSMFAQQDFSGFRAGFERPELAALLFEFSQGAYQSPAHGRWVSMAREALAQLEREGFPSAGGPKRALERARAPLRELERIMWTKLDHVGQTLAEADRRLLASSLETIERRAALVGVQLRLARRGHRRSIAAAIVPAMGRGDGVFAHAQMLLLALEGHEEALRQLVQAHALEDSLGYTEIKRDPELGAAAGVLLDRVVRTSLERADTKRKGFVESARKRLRAQGVAAPSDARAVVWRAWQRAHEALERSTRELVELVASQRGSRLVQALERWAGRGEGAAHLELARCYGRGARGVERRPGSAREHLYCALMASSAEGALALALAALAGVEELPAAARSILEGAGAPIVELAPDRDLAEACLRAARHARGQAGTEGRALLQALQPKGYESHRSSHSEDWERAHELVLERLRELD
ncbi:MAG TPA: hypothetical protein DEA08_27285 [Planctomycetes bacterium]|nr:hypothetical protein [Planctomycetota bacterium]